MGFKSTLILPYFGLETEKLVPYPYLKCYALSMPPWLMGRDCGFTVPIVECLQIAEICRTVVRDLWILTKAVGLQLHVVQS